ncbi:hypothetical protein [Pararhodobacter sp. CCB-MM2]|uniref:hypothetical protein n=1 Tax=Pararhodobacter sp. CCB-MM2 TaxID=1786003 RepID=UPI001314EEDD|nr:hypothetical protein [Pararhodobacter sp. CCB-MM2]MCA2010696.1 hypothetical protein [Cereibacter sphaeroides]
MPRPFPTRSKFDLYDDLMAISRIETSMNSTTRRKTREISDYSRLQRFIPNLKV